MGWGVSVTPRQHLTPGKDPVPIVQEAGWASGPVWTGAENIAPPGFDPRTVQPVGSRYTDYATRPTYVYIYIYIYICLPRQVPGRLRPRISRRFGTTRVVGRQSKVPAAFTPGEIPGTHFQRLSRPQGTWFCRGYHGNPQWHHRESIPGPSDLP